MSYGIIDNYSKDFRLNLTLEINQETLKSFITHYIEFGNTIATAGWFCYDFLLNNGDYHHDNHLHGDCNFGYGLNSASHLESIWAQIKA